MTWPEFESIVKDNCTHYALSFFFFLYSKFNKFLETSIMMIEEENMPLNGPIWLALPVPYQVSFLFFS